MKCPYCGEEMEQGVIQSQHGINWMTKKHLIGASEYHEGSVVLSASSIFKGSAVVSHLCRKCKKVIIDYEDGKCDCNHSK